MLTEIIRAHHLQNAVSSCGRLRALSGLGAFFSRSVIWQSLSNNFCIREDQHGTLIVPVQITFILQHNSDQPGIISIVTVYYIWGLCDKTHCYLRIKKNVAYTHRFNNFVYGDFYEKLTKEDFSVNRAL